VLVTGGFADTTEENVLGSAELYDWTTRTWTATGAMITPRANHTATLLRDGTVLVVGGYCPGRTRGCPELSPGGAIDPDGAITLAEIYDPHTGVWTATGSMATARYLQSATLLDDGRVLVAGAEHGMPDAILPTTEIYDPATNAWQMVGDMTVGRTQQFTVKLDDGEVLVAGGMGPISPTDHGVLNSAEIYRPSIETWRRIGTELEPTDLLTPRAQGGAAVLLTNGMVLMAGGNGDNGRVLASAELFDSRIPSWTATGSLNTTRAELACAVLADGRVLVMGGFDAPENGKLLTSAETYDADTGTWSDAGDMRVPRFGHRATLLDDGTVLVSGGFTSGDATSSAELFDPSLER
jgi:N-acetylneuraminic acid mutarotase